MLLFNDTSAAYNATLANFHTLQNSTSVYDDLAWYACGTGCSGTQRQKTYEQVHAF